MPDRQEVIDSRDPSASPVFVDVTGRRRKRLRRIGYAAAALCGGYSIMIGVSLAGGPVSPQTLLPKIGGEGKAKVVPSSKQRPPADEGPGAFPPPSPSSPVRTTPGAPAAPRPSGSAPSGAAVPSPSAPGGRRTAGPRASTGTPSRPAATPPAAPPPTDPASAPATPPETTEPPAGADERRDESVPAPQAAAAASPVAESGPTAPAAGAQG